MNTRRQFTWLCAAAISLAAFAAPAQTAFPNKPVRILSPFPAGSGPDAVARIVGEKLSQAWSQGVVVENRPGASGFIAISAAKQTQPTGYDLLLGAADHMAMNPALFKKLPYDAVKDFVPVSGLYRTSFFVIVGANSPIKTIPQLIAFARSGPNAASYGSNAVGGPLHLGGAQFEAAIGANMQHVPYKETTALYQAVANNELTWALGSIGSAGPLITAGKLRVLAVADLQRSPALPDVPTLAEAGGPANVVAVSWVALFAPTGTPPAIVNQIGDAVHTALNMPDVKAKLAGIGFVPAPVSGPTVSQWMATDTPRYVEMVKRTGASVD